MAALDWFPDGLEAGHPQRIDAKRSVRKLISSFNSPTLTKPLSVTDAKKAGFTVLKRTGKGEYERQ